MVELWFTNSEPTKRGVELLPKISMLSPLARLRNTHAYRVDLILSDRSLVRFRYNLAWTA